MLYLVTQNKEKIRAASRSFENTGISLLPVDRDYPEIQADTSAEIARIAALEAARDYQHPAIREDHSLFIRHLGIPGPYTQYIERMMPAEKLLELLSGAPDRTGYFELSAAYAEPSGFFKDFTYKVEIHIKEHIEVPDNHGGWNGVLALAGDQRAFTEYPETERVDVWRKNFDAIAVFLTDRGQTPKIG